MMVCGSIVSNEALAGAVSGLKAVPLTTTVSGAASLAATSAAAAGTASKAPTNKAKHATVPFRRVEILDMFGKLNADGLTVLIVTHDPDVSAFTKRAVRMKDGVIEAGAFAQGHQP